MADDPAIVAAEAARDARGRGLLVATDFDGTLAEIVSRPGDAILRDDARRALKALAPLARIAIVSGRALSDLRARVAVEGVALAGEHGGDILLPSGERREVEVPPEDREAQDAFARYAQLLLHGTGGEVERKRLAIAAHTRGVEEEARPRLRDALLFRGRELARGHALSVLEGKEVVELRANDASKGLGLSRLRALLGPEAHVIAMGDDATDEDLFREAASRGGTTVKVGEGPSVARFRLEGPPQVVELLEALVSKL